MTQQELDAAREDLGLRTKDALGRMLAVFEKEPEGTMMSEDNRNALQVVLEEIIALEIEAAKKGLYPAQGLALFVAKAREGIENKTIRH